MLGNFFESLPVSKLVEVIVLHVGKGVKFGIQKAKISAADPPVLEMGRIVKNMLSALRVKMLIIHEVLFDKTI